MYIIVYGYFDRERFKPWDRMGFHILRQAHDIKLVHDSYLLLKVDKDSILAIGVCTWIQGAPELHSEESWTKSGDIG